MRGLRDDRVGLECEHLLVDLLVAREPHLSSTCSFYGCSTTRELRDIGYMGTITGDDKGTITTTADRCFRALLTTTKGPAKFNLSVCTGLYQPETPRATCWIAKEPPPQRYLQCSPLPAQLNLRPVARLNRRQAAPRVLRPVDG